LPMNIQNQKLLNMSGSMNILWMYIMYMFITKMIGLWNEEKHQATFIMYQMCIIRWDEIVEKIAQKLYIYI
jgi:hypothetical protein